MNIQQLDDDCLKAVLIRLPVKDFIRNVKPVSRRFRDVTEFSLTHLIAREPISLEVCSGCTHSCPEPNGPPKVTVAGMRVATTNLPGLRDCSLLPLVSKVLLCDPFCSLLPMDFKLQLRAILQKISVATTLELALKAAGHDGRDCYHHDEDPTDCHVRDCDERPFLELAFNAACLLSQLDSLEFSLIPDFLFDSNNLNDFAQFLTFARRLQKLVVPIPLFECACNTAGLVLRQLSALELFAINVYGESQSTCQAVFETITAACPELTALRYDCLSQSYSEGSCCHAKKGCVTDLGVCQRLSKLRSLTLNFGESSTTEPQLGNLPSLEFLSLALSSSDRALQMLRLLKISRNLKSLVLLQQRDYHYRGDSLPVADMLARLKSLLVAGALPQLEALRLDIAPGSSNIYEQIHEITTIPAHVSLRKIKIIDLSCSCVIALPSANTTAGHFGPRTGITYAISSAANIAELCFPMEWLDSYLQLEQLLLAMQHGSLKRLVVATGLYRERPQFGMDIRAVAAILPAGCQIADWIVSLKDHKDILKSIVIIGYKLGLEGTLLCSEENKFWVHIEAMSVRKGYY